MLLAGLHLALISFLKKNLIDVSLLLKPYNFDKTFWN